jgi:hypothetical protein
LGDVTWEWRRLHDEELDNLYFSLKVIRVMKSIKVRWAGHVACMGERSGADRVSVGKPEGRRPLGRLMHRWDDIKMNLQEMEWKHGLN